VSDPLEGKLVIGISTMALFDLEEADRIFKCDGLPAYRAYQRAHEAEVLDPGTGFALVKGLLALRDPRSGEPLVEVVLISRNDADSCVRVFNSIESHRLAITRGAFCGGRDPWPFLPVFRCDLFLSAEPKAVQEALRQGTPAGLVMHRPDGSQGEDASGEVRIAFDGDSVLFDEESDRIWREHGQAAFFRHEFEHADVPLSPGPFQPLLEALARLQARFPEDAQPVRTALVTARNAPAHFRVVNTFRHWGLRVDEVYLLGGIAKIELLSRLHPHIFFDDQLATLEQAACTVPSAHVPAVVKQLDMLFVEGQGQTGPKAKAGRPKSSRRSAGPPSTAKTVKAVANAATTMRAAAPVEESGAVLPTSADPKAVSSQG
jgi:5'-nucleotidase